MQILLSEQQKAAVKTYLQTLSEAYHNQESSMNDDDAEALDLFLTEMIDTRIDYAWLEIAYEYLLELTYVEWCSKDEGLLSILNDLKTKKEEIDAAIKEANDLKVSPDITTKKATELSSLRNDDFYDFVKRYLSKPPTSSQSQTIQQELFNRGFDSFNTFGSTTGATKYADFTSLSGYLNSLPK